MHTTRPWPTTRSGCGRTAIPAATVETLAALHPGRDRLGGGRGVVRGCDRRTRLRRCGWGRSVRRRSGSAVPFGTPSIAAFANSAAASALDLDDGHRAAGGHPGAAVIPAVFAVAQEAQGRVARGACGAHGRLRGGRADRRRPGRLQAGHAFHGSLVRLRGRGRGRALAAPVGRTDRRGPGDRGRPVPGSLGRGLQPGHGQPRQGGHRLGDADRRVGRGACRLPGSPVRWTSWTTRRTTTRPRSRPGWGGGSPSTGSTSSPTPAVAGRTRRSTRSAG